MLLILSTLSILEKENQITKHSYTQSQHQKHYLNVLNVLREQ